MSEEIESLKWSGFIREIGLSGDGAASGLITFVVRNPDANEDAAFNVYSNQSPQVFWAIETTLTAAYFMNARVEISYRIVPGHTNYATAIKVAHYLV